MKSIFCSRQVWPHVQEAARQPLRWGAKTPKVPGVCGLRRRRLYHPVLTQGGRHLWRWRGRYGGRSEPVLQHWGLQLHPQRPGRHCGAAWPVWPATDPRGGQRVLQPGSARRRSQRRQHLQLVVLFLHFLILVQSEFPAADCTRRGGRQRDPAPAYTLSHTSAAGTHTCTAGPTAWWLLNNRPRWEPIIINNKWFLRSFTHYLHKQCRVKTIDSKTSLKTRANKGMMVWWYL